MPKRLLFFLFAIVFLAVLAILWPKKPQAPKYSVNSYQECVAAGNPVLQSYPNQCTTKDGKIFVEQNIEEK